MIQRKPARTSFPDWIEGQIVTAQRAGAFDDLPGTGKPIPGLDKPRNDLDWVAGYLHREEADVAAVLPPQLALAKEVEDLQRTLAKLHSEARVRTALTELNDRIRAAHRSPQDGPPLRVRTVDVEQAVAAWRASRPAPATRVAPAAPSPKPKRRWLPRREPSC